MININSQKLSLNDYNLSYDFINGVLGIDCVECYPFKSGFCISDRDGKKYLLFKILKKDIERFEYTDNLIKDISKFTKDVLGLYFIGDNKYFYDIKNSGYYVVFKYGDYKKWVDFDIESTFDLLRDFYVSSYDILEDLYNFNLKEDIKILGVGNEIISIDSQLEDIKKINDFISYKGVNDELSEMFLYNRDYMVRELNNLREFFLSERFATYLSNHNNYRFIIGDISNKSFVFEGDKISIANFYSSSVDLFVKDFAVFTEKSITNLVNGDIKKYIYELLRSFDGDINEHLYVICNYIRLNSYMFKWFNSKFKHNDNLNISEKYRELDSYINAQSEFLKEISFT